MRGERPGIKGVNSIRDIKVASFIFSLGGGGGGGGGRCNLTLTLVLSSL